MKNYKVQEIKQAIQQAKQIQIIVPQLSVDGVASATALALALKKQNKEVSVFSPQKPDANYSKLAGMDLLVEPSTSQDLTIELSYPMDSIEKVSYDYDEQVSKLKLFVVTKPGSPKINNSQINIINESGSTSDLTIVLGDPTLLGDKISMVQKGTVVQISATETPSFNPTHKIFDPDAPFSEIFTFLLPLLGLELDVDPAKNLLIALRVSTQSFAVNVSPESFEAGAICLRASQLGLEQLPQAEAPPVATVENKEKTGQNKPNPSGVN